MAKKMTDSEKRAYLIGEASGKKKQKKKQSKTSRPKRKKK